MPATDRGRNRRNAVPAALFGLGLLLLVAAGLVTHPLKAPPEFAPRLAPLRYLWIAIPTLGTVVCAALAGWCKRDRWSDPWVAAPLALAGLFFLVLLANLAAVPSARALPFSPQAAPFPGCRRSLPGRLRASSCWAIPRGGFLPTRLACRRRSSAGCARGRYWG